MMTGVNSKMDVRQFDKIAREVFAPAYISIAERIKEKTGITSGVCVDIGSGGGYLSIALAGITNMIFFLLDQSHEMLGIAKRNIVESHLEKRLFTLHADVHNIPLDGESVDLVVSRGSVFFWENKTRAFREIYRVLVPGGRAYVGGGLGSHEIQIQIKAKMKEIGHTWHGRSKRNEDHRKIYGEALKKAGITNCSVVKGEEGLWIEIYK